MPHRAAPVTEPSAITAFVHVPFEEQKVRLYEHSAQRTVPLEALLQFTTAVPPQLGKGRIEVRAVGAPGDP